MKKPLLYIMLICVLSLQVSVMAEDPVPGAVPKMSPEPAATEDVFKDRVIAKIDGVPVMLSEVEKNIDNFEAKFREISPNMKLPEERRVQMRKDFLDRLIKDKILESAASKTDFKVTEEAIDDRISQLQKIFGEGEEAKHRFMSGIKDMKEFRGNISRQIKIDSFLDDQMKNRIKNISADDITKYYTAHQQEFAEKESVMLSHILWRLPPKESTEYSAKLESARNTAKEVVQLAKSGKDFGELAKKYSEDKATVEKGGDMGWIQKGRMIEAFETAAFALKAGEISAPIETAFGVHLILLKERREARVPDQAEVNDKIRSILERQYKSANREKIYEDLRSSSKVEILL